MRMEVLEATPEGGRRYLGRGWGNGGWAVRRKAAVTGYPI
jgi:hypothetical protein